MGAANDPHVEPLRLTHERGHIVTTREYFNEKYAALGDVFPWNLNDGGQSAARRETVACMVLVAWLVRLWVRRGGEVKLLREQVTRYHRLMGLHEGDDEDDGLWDGEDDDDDDDEDA